MIFLGNIGQLIGITVFFLNENKGNKPLKEKTLLLDHPTIFWIIITWEVSKKTVLTWSQKEVYEADKKLARENY